MRLIICRFNYRGLLPFSILLWHTNIVSPWIGLFPSLVLCEKRVSFVDSLCVLLPAMEQAGDKADSGLEDTQIALGQRPVPPSPQSSVHKKKTKKRKWAEQSQLCDPRVDPMQKQLEKMRKTIDYMAAQQRCQQRLMPIISWTG